jgi:hypothetical protein
VWYPTHIHRVKSTGFLTETNYVAVGNFISGLDSLQASIISCLSHIWRKHVKMYKKTGVFCDGIFWKCVPEVLSRKNANRNLFFPVIDITNTSPSLGEFWVTICVLEPTFFRNIELTKIIRIFRLLFKSERRLIKSPARLFLCVFVSPTNKL